jgi:hypothetical protein
MREDRLVHVHVVYAFERLALEERPVEVVSIDSWFSSVCTPLSCSTSKREPHLHVFQFDAPLLKRHR